MSLRGTEKKDKSRSHVEPSANGRQYDSVKDGKRCLEAALDYAELGWSVHALCPPGTGHEGMSDKHRERCGNPGKVPWDFWKKLQEKPQSADEIRDQWRRVPCSNVGLLLGPVSGLVRIDMDGPSAEAALLKLSGGSVPETLEFTSGKGRGLLFAIPAGVELKTTPKTGGLNLADGELRCQAKGAQTVLPPSRHENGKRYRWKEGHGPGEIEAAPMPDWMIQAMRADNPERNGRTTTKVPQTDGTITTGGRRDWLTSQAGKMRRIGFEQEEIAAALLVLNDKHCKPVVEEKLVLGIAKSILRYHPQQTSLTPPRPYQPFPVDVMPEPFRSLILQAAKSIQADPAMIAVPMLAVIASAIGATRRLKIKQRYDEPSCVWSAVVCESGERKSGTLDAAFFPCERKEREANEKYKEAEAKYVDELKKAGKKKGGASIKPPVHRRYYTGDTTVEKLAQILRDNPRGLLLKRDELSGLITGFDRFHGGKGSDVAHYNEMHRGADIVIDRKTGNDRHIYAPKALLSITGTIQPDTLRDSLSKEFFQNGFAARLLLTMPPRQRGGWADDDIDPEIERTVEQAFKKLYELELDPEDNRAVKVTFTDDALEIWKQFCRRHGKEQIDRFGDLAAAWSKLMGYCGRFALILEFARWAGTVDPRGIHSAPPNEVHSKSLLAAKKLVRWFCNETERVYEMLTENKEEGELRELDRWIEARGGTISVRTVQQKGPKHFRKSAADAETALQKLVDRGQGYWEYIAPGPKGGQPSRRYCQKTHCLQNPENPREKRVV
jgi:hypothetical protein